MLDSNTKIHIIGGSGAIGSWLKFFFESLRLNVSISDERNKPKDLGEADIIFISVPIEIAPKIILETAKKTNWDCLIVDLSSIKSETAKSLKKIDRESLSMHFLFGPAVSSISNQKIICENFGLGKKANELLKLLEKEGAQIIKMDAESHDFYMAHIQSLTHFLNLSFAETLIHDKVGIKGDISTPIFLSQLSATLRVITQTPRLISEIQVLNPKFIKILENFMEIQNSLIAQIKDKNIEKLEKQFENLRKNLESSDRIYTEEVKKQTKQQKFESLKIGYLGPEGTFSNQAALKLFSEKKNYLLKSKNIDELFEAINLGQVDLIVAPAENTIEGAVRETLDLLMEHNLKIIGRVDLEISQCLLSKSKSLSNIKKVISHSQALSQSRNFLRETLPNAVLESSASTIASVENLKDTEVAIIGSELAAKIYNLNILCKDIQNSKNNITRFYVISKKDILKLKNRTKSLLFLTVFNRVGILRDILSIFADLSINLNRIESRPSKEKNWDYYFFIEIELTDEDPRFDQALNILKQYCPTILVLGKL